MLTSDLDFFLPPQLIAQTPADRREASRLLHYHRATGRVTHRVFADLPDLLGPGDLLVLNDTRVVPARLDLRKATGGHIEGLFLHETSPGSWRVMLRGMGSSRVGLHFVSDPAITASIINVYDNGEYELQLSVPAPATELLKRLGRMPLPPYIKRQREHDQRDPLDQQRYQTIYARDGQSVAAPTAGLHFTPELFQTLEQRGINKTFVTLDVGLGTFKPVTVDRLEQHSMHTEHYTITPQAAADLNAARQHKRRIIAVGTTAARVLESQPQAAFEPRVASTSIFIHPPYNWKHVDGLITNFHLPRSTLIALVVGFIGLAEQRRLYQLAIQQEYRFFSYGDAMFID